MDDRRNPYCPGAGIPPTELAGRSEVIESVQIAIERAKAGRSAENHVMLGLRGVGKTVLFVNFEKIAEQFGCYPTNVIEVDHSKTLPQLLLPQLYRLMIRLDRIKQIGHTLEKGFRLLRSVASAFNVKIGSLELCVSDGEATGDLASDLSDVFVELGEIAASRKTSAIILLDEIQGLSINEFSALIIALHKISQRKLPLTFIGAGLPQLPKLAGDAKSYSERLFRYTTIDKLERQDAIRALVEPAATEDVEYDEDAISMILKETHGYPYYIQLWGSESWKAAISSPIELEDVKAATTNAKIILDDSLFATRLQRLTDRQQEYALAMAKTKLPAKSSEIAASLGMTLQQAAPVRDELIKKGMAFSPKKGLINFTIPLFDAFIRRELGAKKNKRKPKTLFG